MKSIKCEDGHTLMVGTTAGHCKVFVKDDINEKVYQVKINFIKFVGDMSVICNLVSTFERSQYLVRTHLFERLFEVNADC